MDQTTKTEAAFSEPPVTITESEFARFRDFFYQKTGIRFDDTKRYFVDRRLVERINKTDQGSFLAYFTNLRFERSQRELQELINLMTVNETYFFREDYQLKCMVNSVLSETVRRKKARSTIRIWCVPCSTGEEAYSIAIYLLANWPPIHNIDVELLASDIDTKVLKKCRDGYFDSRSVQHVPDSTLRTYFENVRTDCYRVNANLRDAINFSRVNITDPMDTGRFRDIDIIFCRNMLIYFDDISQRVAADAIYSALSPGGFLFLGHSESMSRISSLFKIRKFPDAIVYQRPV